MSLARTVHVVQEGPANALAMNRDASQVVIAGRNGEYGRGYLDVTEAIVQSHALDIFKIFSVEDEELVEKLNLRVGKYINLNYSCADVVWNPAEDNILATAATNGAVVTWNLNKPSRSKQDMVFQDHKRTVNKVSFHPIEPNILISGSQDGTMKNFDLRRKEVTNTFYSNSESVRDVQFSPHQYFVFAAVQENGNVQLWDLRRTDRYERQFTGHSGPVFACDWHPEEKLWLATAGRDKTIKVWDLESRPVLEYTIHTIASVARIKWRPLRKYHIASSSLVVDFSVNIWDVRRPYIPFAAFNEHKDVTTGIAWRNSPHVFLSTSKDCTLYQHSFHDAVRPAERANPIGLDVNSSGDIVLAVSNRILNSSSHVTSVKGAYPATTRLPAIFRKGPSLSDQFPAAISSCCVLQNRFDKHLSIQWLVESAKQYRLTGHPFAEMCDHNAAVAMTLDRPLVSQTWSMLKLLYSNSISVISTTAEVIRPTVVSDAVRLLDADKAIQPSEPSLVVDIQNDGQSRPVRHLSGSNHRHHSGGGDRPVGGDTSGGFSEEDTETDETDHERTLTNIASGLASMHGDFFFGDGEIDHVTAAFDYDYMPTGGGAADSANAAAEDWTLPNEAFQPRHDIQTQSPPPEQFACMSTVLTASSGANLRGAGRNANAPATSASHHGPTVDVAANEQELLVAKPFVVPNWDSTSLVVDMLHHYATQGDVQMSVSVIIVLGDRLKGVIDEQTQEQWFTSYVDLLTRFQLWTVSNQVIKLSSLPGVSMMNQQSTTVHTNCSKCLRQFQRVGWLCDRCKKLTNTCSVCHRVVKGLYVWCQGCCHGGHLKHIQDWLEESPWCPTGCGHMCEYT